MHGSDIDDMESIEATVSLDDGLRASSRVVGVARSRYNDR